MNSELEKIKGPIEYIKEALVIYTKKENFIFFSKIMAVLVILSSAIGYVYGYLFPFKYPAESIDYSNIPTVIVFVILTLLSAVVGLWSQSTQYFAILKMGDPEKEIFKLGYTKIIRFLVISFALGIIIAFGAILLIIPAIMFGVWYSFSIWLVLDKEMGVFEALKVSKQMVAGKFWKVLGRSFVFGFFSFLISLVFTVVPYAGNLVVTFLAPLFMLPFYLMYKDLSVDSGL